MNFCLKQQLGWVCVMVLHENNRHDAWDGLWGHVW